MLALEHLPPGRSFVCKASSAHHNAHGPQASSHLPDAHATKTLNLRTHFPYETPQVIDLMLAHPQLGRLLAHPSVSYGPTPLYMRGVLEEDTQPNLDRKLRDLLESCMEGGEEALQGALQLTVNDKKLNAPLRVRLRLE